mgnify:CR=1 FL=1|jgi:hypothetical protein
METRNGKNGWILCRLNRGYDNPFPDSDMDVILEPYQFADVVPWDIACDNVAKDIYNQYKGKKLFLAFGGGIDGENVAKTFLRNNIPFTPIIFKVDSLHDLDTWWAERWCKENGVEPYIYDTIPLREFALRMVQINQRYCTRTASGPALIEYCKEYAESQGGVLVTGAGFPEYFPDENLEYLGNGAFIMTYTERGEYVVRPQTFRDHKLVDENREPLDHGYVWHEPDIINGFICQGHPWNFLSWTPEIVLSYICERDYTLTSADDKARIMKCLHRPKVAGLHKYVYQTWPILQRWLWIRKGIGNSEVDFIGNVPKLKKLLGNIDE